MGTTSGGIVYPDPTDVPDVPADLQALAESVETEFLTGGAWSTSTTGFTAASPWTLNSVRYRVVGAVCELAWTITRTTSVITASATSNIAANAMLSAIPAAIRPSGTAMAYSGAAGRVAMASVNSDGTVSLEGFAGTSDWGSTESAGFRAVYLLG